MKFFRRRSEYQKDHMTWMESLFSPFSSGVLVSWVTVSEKSSWPKDHDIDQWEDHIVSASRLSSLLLSKKAYTELEKLDPRSKNGFLKNYVEKVVQRFRVTLSWSFPLKGGIYSFGFRTFMTPTFSKINGYLTLLRLWTKSGCNWAKLSN